MTWVEDMAGRRTGSGSKLFVQPIFSAPYGNHGRLSFVNGCICCAASSRFRAGQELAGGERAGENVNS